MKEFSRRKKAELNLIATLTEEATLATASKLSELAKNAAKK